MGAAASSASEKTGDGARGGDDAAFDRVRKTGMPFALLHDETYLLQKYQELVRGIANKDADGDADACSSKTQQLVMTGIDDIPVSELQQMQDASWSNVFTSQRSVTASAESGSDGSGKASAQSAMRGTSLARSSLDRVASETRREQQTGIVQDYLAQLVVRMEQRALASQAKDRLWKQQHGGDQSVDASVDSAKRNSSRRTSLSAVAAAAGLFKVGSFAMNLKMLSGFRIAMPTVFEDGVLALIETVLEFPPFVLHGTDASKVNDSEAAATALLVDDAHRFSEKLLAQADLSSTHRDLLLVLVLSLGVCTGRSSYLLEFATSVFGESFAQTVPLSGWMGECASHELVESILTRLESFRIHYDLGRLDTSSRTAEVFIKAIDQGVAMDSSAQQLPHTVATDGTYVYVWNTDFGLQKIGTGLNFSVAGRVYASVPSHRYRNQIRTKKHFLASFIGSAEDVTERVRHVMQQEADAMATTPISELVGNAESSGSLSRKLYVQYRDSSRLYDESEFLETEGSLTVADTAESVRFAVFGEFVSLHPEAVQVLHAASLSLGSEGEAKGAEVDATLLLDLYDRCGIHDKVLTGDEQLIVVSSGVSSPRVEKYSLGRKLDGYEDGGEVYYSSLTLAAGKLYLSQLTPLSLEGQSESRVGCVQPRSLLVISPADLKVEKSVQLSSGDADQSSFTVANGVTRPLFTYTSEGNQLYEIEITATRFVVRVFSVLAQSGTDQLTFTRAYAVDIKDCNSEGFVDGLAVFLELLKSDLRASEMGFVFPSFYTNGSYLCAVLPRVSDDKSNPTYDCALCKYEGDVPESASPSRLITESKVTDVFSWAEPISGCCFDPFNNVVWILNMSKGALCSFQNSGKKINVIAETEDDAVARSNEPEPESVQPRELADVAALRVLSFVAKHADMDVSSDAPGAVQPFAATLDAPSLVTVLAVATKLATTRHTGKATTMEQRALDCCLRVLDRTLRDTINSSGTTASTLLPMLHSGLPPLLSLITASADAKTNDDRAVKLDLRIVARAIEMNASTMQLAEGGLASQLDQLVKWATKSKSAPLSPMDTLLATSLMDQFQRAIARVDGLTLLSLESQFENLWNELVAVEVENLWRVSTFSSSDLRSQVHRELLSTVTTFVQILFVRAGDDLELFRFAARVFNNICRGLRAVVDAATTAATSSLLDDRVLGEGALLQITPTVLVPVTHVLRLAFGVNGDSVREEIKQELRKLLLEDVVEISALFKSLNQLSEVLNAEAKAVKTTFVETVKRSKVMESAHPYLDDLDYTTELRIPGAKKITITFDDRTRTENDYDHLIFYKDEGRTGHYGRSKYTGRDDDAKWPGLGDLAPLVIKSDHCYVRFVSDGSNTDWGFKFTAVAEVQEKTIVVERHWASALSEMALGVLVEVGKLLLGGTQLVPITSVEARNDTMLRHDLLRYGLASEAEQSAGAVSLLREFVAASDGSDAKRLILALKEKSANPRLLHRGSSLRENNPVNVAIQAAAAAILHHNRQGVDAYAFAQNLRDDVPEELVQAWKVAQKMRDWFHVGDAAEAARLKIGSASTRQLKRQPSAYAGMADEALDVLTKAVIERAQFLLELTPSALPGSSVSKRRWSALAKYAPALRTANADATPLSSLGKWYNAVDALKEPKQLRSLLQYQRSASERLKHPATKSINEKVLEFLQSDIDVSEVREAIKARNQRAAYRSTGLKLLARATESTSSVPTKSIIVDTYSSCLSAMVTHALEAIGSVLEPTSGIVVASTPLHVSSMLGGCSTHLGRDVTHTFKSWVLKLSAELDAFVDGKDDPATTEYAALVLKALCVDYEAEDALLLRESGLIDRLRQLLGCNSLRVRRSAQVLLDILLLRLGEKRSSASDNDSLFQQQLYDTIGHQLNEATMAMCTADKPDAGNSSIYDISRGMSGRTLAIPEKDEIQWNHSIMAWVYVPSEQSRYALQVGDEVRPGPTISATQEVKGNGVVSAILSPTTVRVRWHASGIESEHEFDPSAGKKDVVLADSSAGGVVFGKGALNLDRGSEFARPWSHFGLYLDDQYEVSYKISCGTDKECVYETKHALKIGAWSHVAVVQREAELVVFVNGEKVSQHELDPFLVLEDGYCAAESRIVESIHPVPSYCDHFYGVQFPGASKIRVAFDPLCATDESTGNLRFFKDTETPDQWCDEKELGAGVTGSMVIPSDYFRIQLDKGEGEGYGFRLLATPAFSDRAPPTRVLNSHPLYVGVPPVRVANDAAAKCWVSTPMTVNKPLDEEGIVAMMTASRPVDEAPQDIPVDQALYVLGLVQRSLSSTMGREVIAIPRNIERVLQLAFDDLVPVEVRCAATAVLKQLGTSVDAKLLNECFKRFVTTSRDRPSIVDFVFDGLVRVIDVWSPPNDSGGSETRVSSNESQTLGAAYSSLLRSLARHDIWRQDMKALIESVVTQWEDFLARRDEHETSDSDFGSSGSRMITVLSLFGGNFASVTSGGRVKCLTKVNDAEVIETGYLIRNEARGGEQIARVLLDSDVAKPVLLASKDVLYLADEDNVELEAFVATIVPELFNGSLHRFFAHQLLDMASGAMDATTRFERKTLQIKNGYIHESAHPYTTRNVTTEVFFNNAKEVEITFDSMTELIGPDDFMQFIKRSNDRRSPLCPESGNGKPYWGKEKYTGTNFPGVGDEPPLRIPAGRFGMQFCTEVEGGWGFKVYMRAIEERIVYGPERPPSSTVFAMNEVRSRAMKALRTCLGVLPSAPESPLLPLLPQILSLANAEDDGRPTQLVTRWKDFESTHPYKKTGKQYVDVCFPGATRLSIVFDDRTETKSDEDYLTFFKDRSLTDYYGEKEYSGVKANISYGNHWPGVTGPVLVIPADSFTFFWSAQKDSSHWGWKFTVTAEFPMATPLMSPLDQLEQQAHDLWSINYEGPVVQTTPQGSWSRSDVQEVPALECGQEAVPSPTELVAVSEDVEATRGGIRRITRVRAHTEDPIDVFESASQDAAVVGRFPHGHLATVVEEITGWFKISLVNGVGEQAETVNGWVKQRAGDDLRVMYFDAWLETQESVIVGVDDSDVALLSAESASEVEPVGVRRSAFSSEFSCSSLAGHESRLTSFGCDVHRALAIKYARSVVSSLLVGDVSTARPLSLADFGSTQEVLQVLSRALVDSEEGVDEAVLEQHVVRMLGAPESQTQACAIVNECISKLEGATHSWRQQRTVVLEVESTHPYTADLDEYTTVTIAGAKKIYVYFDPRSQTEAICDYVRFYKSGSDRSERHGLNRYSGRKRAANWPGVDGRPPLVIDADSFEVYFHTDQLLFDWGYKLFAVGVFESDDEVVSSVDAASPSLLDLRVALWGINTAAKACLARDISDCAVASAVYSTRVMEVVVRCLQNSPVRVRLAALQLLVTLAQRGSFIRQLPLSLVQALWRSLEARGRALEEEPISEHFKLLVEAMVVVDLALDSGRFCDLQDSTARSQPTRRVAPRWYDAIRDSVSTLLDFQDPRQLTVEACESEHPLSVLPEKRDDRKHISIEGAVALEIRFDRKTSLASHHRLQFFTPETDISEDVQGLCGSKSDTEYPALFVSEQRALQTGDRVVRCASWRYGDEDGGAGHVGVVEEVVGWCGEEGMGVRVRWESSEVGVYRYGYYGHYDVELVLQPNARTTPLVIRGSSLEYTFNVDGDGHEEEEPSWGYLFYVIPHFTLDSIGRERFQTRTYQSVTHGVPVDLRHDQQLIKYINKVAQQKEYSGEQLLSLSWSSIAPSAEELVKWPVLVEMMTGTAPPVFTSGEDATEAPIGGDYEAGSARLGERFVLLQRLNRAVKALIPYVKFTPSTIVQVGRQDRLQTATASTPMLLQLRKLVIDQRYRMLYPAKRELLNSVLERTQEDWAKIDLTFNRLKAMRHRVSGQMDSDGHFALFSQAFRRLNTVPDGHFRRASALYKVYFLGENAQDAGGPYRETLAQFAEELHSPQLPLLITSSNALHNVGAGREKWVLNPSSTSATALKMFEFLGKLMGAAMRSQDYMPLQIAGLIWKKLAGEAVTTDDLALVDSMLVNSMEKIRTIDQCGVTADMFEDIVMETFTTLSTDNRTVALKPNGASIPVTFDSRVEFADLVEAYRLREFDVQIEAILRGLATVVPVHLLSLFTGVEMELMVCGSPEVDVDLLQRCTEYSGCRATDDHIVWFWQVQRAFSHEERSAFLRFVWGRSRLPANEKEFPQRFKLQSFNKTVNGSVDKYLPISHTCFFSVEMPQYSSAEVLRERLLYAMYNCQEIDGDGDTIAANQLNWES